MPVLFKPPGDLNIGPNSGDPLNQRGDGFDPLIPYQMIPLNDTREIGARTGDFKAEMTFSKPDVCSMSNFRILSQRSPSLFPLPGPGVHVRRVMLPERSVIQFTLSGRAPGITELEGRDRPGHGSPMYKDFGLEISVKTSEVHRVAVCYVFDRIHRDTGARGDFAGHLAEAHKIFRNQSNVSILNIDGASANTSAARTIAVAGAMGKVFNLLDNKLIGRVIDGFDAKYPGVFGQVDTVLMSIPVPLRIKKLPKIRILGISIRYRRQSTGRKYNLLFVGPQALRRRPTSGGPRPTPLQQLRNTIAHELGHGFGLKHYPAEEKDLPPLHVGKSKEINPEFYKAIYHNVMFPTTLILSNRINGAQAEKLHTDLPEYREVDF